MHLLIGVNSKIGSELGRLLLERGERVRVVVRQESVVAAVRSRGYEVFIGDLALPETVRPALEGVDSIFLLTSPAANDVFWHQNAIDLALESGIRHLVRSSILGANSVSASPIMQHHGEIDDLLETSGVPYTILRPNYFQQNVIESILPGIDSSGRFYWSSGPARMSMVDTRDVSEVAFRILVDHPDQYLGKIYNLTGPEALSAGDVAHKLRFALNREISHIDISLQATRETFECFGMNRWLVNALVGLYEEHQRSGERGYASEISGNIEEITGRPARNLERLLIEHLSSSRGERFSL